MQETPRNAGVIAPPPLLLLAAIIAGLVLDRAFRLHLLELAPPLLRSGLGWALVALAVAMNAQGFLSFQRRGTPARPWKSSTHLVTDGVFAHVRNPMYVGMVALALGLGFLLAGDWMVMCGLVFWLVLHFGVVRREERYLETIFGEEYRQYKARVPRYGWRF